MSTEPDILLNPHDYPGRLIIVEGIDGSGKSTQIKLVQRWLENKGYDVFFTECAEVIGNAATHDAATNDDDARR